MEEFVPMDPVRMLIAQAKHANQERENLALRIEGLFDSLDEADTRTLRDLMAAIGSGTDVKLASHFDGYLTGRLKWHFKVCATCGGNECNVSNIDEALDDILGETNAANREAALKPDPNPGYVQGTLFEADDIQESPKDAIRQNAAAYGVIFSNALDLEGPVICEQCGYENNSLADRMLRDPGVKGCSGCQHKAKWG